MAKHGSRDVVGKRFAREHIPLRVEWMNSPHVRDSMSVAGPVSITGTQEWFDSHSESRERADFVFESLGPQRLGEVIAMGGLTDISPLHRHAELYVFTAPDASGLGFGKAAVAWLLDFAFQSLSLHRVFLFTNADNVRATRLYEALGFRHEGLLREHAWHRGRFVDRVVMGIRDKEWLRDAVLDEAVTER